MTILVTGSSGMIGAPLVKALVQAGYSVIGIDKNGPDTESPHCRQIRADLEDQQEIISIVHRFRVDRCIHLAALAHTVNEDDLSWERYKRVNVDGAANLFHAAGNRPVLFISTVDVYGFYDGKQAVSEKTEPHPVSNYGKSKAMAEKLCIRLPHYTIYRFSPVYTDTIKRDIQKRYYLKYPNIGYVIGKGSRFEILNVRNAVAAMVRWCAEEPDNSIHILKDETDLWTPDYLREEKAAGRAKIVLWFPRWAVNFGYAALKTVWGENERTYLLNKAVHPLQSQAQP